MSRKTKRRVKNILFVVILLLVGALAVIYAVSARNAKKELDTSEQEKKELQETVEQLQQENAQLQTQIQELQSADYQQVEAQEETESTPLIDMRATEAGAIVPEDMVNFDDLQQYFCSYEIQVDDDVYQRIIGKSYRENNNIGLSDLAYLKVLHYNFEHEIQVGELIVNAELKEDFCNIFRDLFEEEYEIYSMYLIDNFWTGDGASSDTASIDVNNTSAFCYREITGGSSLSNHAYGRAIDINPQQNPYVSYRSGYPVWSHDNANDYIDRDTGYEHVITHNDVCYLIFSEYGFEWGGDWSTIKDYQHFEKE
ncbi:MAG: M15 family metallopeptidase [Ruminococcus sp.]|nr:M15 family metallopeptidase [Ruminococcus sp.]